MAAGNFTKRVEVNSRDEIGQLASSFNFMAHSLEELEDQRSRFVSDVSHELLNTYDKHLWICTEYT